LSGTKRGEFIVAGRRNASSRDSQLAKSIAQFGTHGFVKASGCGHNVDHRGGSGARQIVPRYGNGTNMIMTLPFRHKAHSK
jgi:hypothetical protein